MALDIRLDFIKNIDPAHDERMTLLRNGFISIDSMLQVLADEATNAKDLGASRTVALARTFNEQALQYGMKSLYLLGEI